LPANWPPPTADPKSRWSFAAVVRYHTLMAIPKQDVPVYISFRKRAQ